MPRFPVLFTLGAVLVCVLPVHAADASNAEFFETKVRPVFVKNCYSCHTTSALRGLRLDSLQSAIKGCKSGPAGIAGKADESLRVQAVRRTHVRFKMPPAGKLNDADIATLVDWIKQGASWPEPGNQAGANGPSEYVITKEQRAFWAYQPVRKPAIAEVQDKKWPQGPIDNFILHRLEKEGVRPVGPAAKRTLIRRATEDLIGMPPTPE